jgi:prepilin-type N-terminal cleavage/methylation domain-containing protein
MKTNTQNNKGFTLIELIMVTIILGILAAVAIPRYSASVRRAEAAAENAVINSIRSGLETYATEKLMDHGRREWPANPFAALATNPAGFDTTNTGTATEDGEWTYNIQDGGVVGTGFGTYDGSITHMRGDNSVETWYYNDGIMTTESPSTQEVGSLGARN